MSTPVANSHGSGEERAAGPSPLPDSAGASVDTDSPWLGLASFTEDTRAFFFGREGEVAELERRVQRKLLTVLFGKSGLGKTSILQAGLVPGLRERGYFPVYLRIDYGYGSPEPAEQIKQAIGRAAAGLGVVGTGGSNAAGAIGGIDPAAAQCVVSVPTAGQSAPPATPALTLDPSESIWEFLHRRDNVLQHVSAATGTVKSPAQGDAAHLPGGSAETSIPRPLPAPAPLTPPPERAFLTPLVPLLIFDQFEELFTLAQSDEFGRTRAARFTEELSDLVENRPPKALEARLDADDRIAERFDFARSDYRVVIALREDYLAPLESLKKVMPSLSQNRLRLAPMTGTQALEAVLRPGKRLVSQEVAEAIVRFVAGGSELQNAEVEPSLLSLICRELNEQRIAQGRNEISQDLLAGSHDSILINFYERALSDQPESVRGIIEDDLLTESGYRENLAEESLLKRFQAAGAAPDALAKLVNHRLLRIEERLDVRRVELTHDVLTGVVKASRDQRHEREAQAATERTLAEQREREIAARQALRRARTIATGCTLLAVVAIVAAVAAFFSVQRARRAEQLAQQTRAISEQAREQAEDLLGFLTDSFVRELQTFGREQTIAKLSQREIDYFRALPASLKDLATIRSGALALVNHGGATGQLGDSVTAGRNLAEAIALLESLRRTDNSDATAIVLGRADVELGQNVWGTAAGIKAAVPLQRAVDLLRPLVMEQPRASIEARRAFLQALAFLEFVNAETRHDAEAIRIEREVQQVGRQLGIPRDGDLNSDADYAFAGMGFTLALFHLGRDDARRAGEEAVALADQVLAQRPQFGYALAAKQITEGVLASSANDDLDPAESLRFLRQEEQTSLTMSAVEPENVTYGNELGLTYEQVATSLWAEGRLAEALPYHRKGIQTLAKITGAGGIPLGNWAFAMAGMAGKQAQLGDSAGAAATIAAAEAFLNSEKLRSNGPARSDPLPAFADGVLAAGAATVAYERADFAAAQRIAGNALEQLRARFPLTTTAPGPQNIGLGELAGAEGQADYRLSDFAAAVQAESTALHAYRLFPTFANGPVAAQRIEASYFIWLSMALAREGKRDEAARTIAPVVTMYRGLEQKNHGDQWLPLELAEALYAQALTDPQHRTVLLRDASGLVDHLIPAIAQLHDTKEWRARIEAAEHASNTGVVP